MVVLFAFHTGSESLFYSSNLSSELLINNVAAITDAVKSMLLLQVATSRTRA